MSEEGSASGPPDQVPMLCEEIGRISGGGVSVTFGELARDEQVTQTFEALFGTLKAARKRGLVTFQGELLLMGQHDNVVVSLTSEGSTTQAPPASAGMGGPGAEQAPGGPGTPPTPPTASVRAASAIAAPAPTAEENRHGDEPLRRSKTWNVDTSYIDYRTADPDRLEIRRDAGDKGEADCVGVPAAARDKDGKWQQVDVSYINHRTGDVERLEGRKSTFAFADPAQGAGPAPAAPSATVRRESDGKWTVDTSYIGHRTGDPNNLRKGGSAGGPAYADPAEQKHSYGELKGVANRPADVDPAQKERYLSDEEFQEVFGMGPADFVKLPKWKQQNLKKAKDMF